MNWINDYSKEQVQALRQTQTRQQALEQRKYFLTEKEFDKYNPIIKQKETTINDVDILIDVTKSLVKNIWIKNRYPEYYSKQWNYLSNLYHTEWSNYLFLNEIKEEKRPLNNLIHIFQYD